MICQYQLYRLLYFSIDAFNENGELTFTDRTFPDKLKVIIHNVLKKKDFEGNIVDNTTNIEVERWIELIKAIKPKEVMIYTIARDTPATGLEKVSLKDLKAIAAQVEALGIPVQVSA